MRLIFDDESVEYVRNCSFYIEPVDNCTQTKYVPFRKEPEKVMNKTTGKSKERLKMSDLTCLASCLIFMRKGGGGLRAVLGDCVEIKEEFKNGLVMVAGSQTMIP